MSLCLTKSGKWWPYCSCLWSFLDLRSEGQSLLLLESIFGVCLCLRGSASLKSAPLVLSFISSAWLLPFEPPHCPNRRRREKRRRRNWLGRRMHISENYSWLLDSGKNTTIKSSNSMFVWQKWSSTEMAHWRQRWEHWSDEETYVTCRFPPAADDTMTAAQTQVVH